MQSSAVSIKLLRPSVDLVAYSDDIWQILTSVDKEFVPALSTRTSETLRRDSYSLRDGPIAFFDMVMKEHAFVAFVEGKPVGFLSFRMHDMNVSLPDYSLCTFVLATVVSLRYRRKGIATMLNDAVENLPASMTSPWIVRRTWSTNDCNLRLLKSRGFDEAMRLPNHRGAGIDTLYMVRRTEAG